MLTEDRNANQGHRRLRYNGQREAEVKKGVLTNNSLTSSSQLPSSSSIGKFFISLSFAIIIA
jgi:hypothetical protein